MKFVCNEKPFLTMHAGKLGTIKFVKGAYSTQDQGIIDYLLAHPLMHVWIHPAVSLAETHNGDTGEGVVFSDWKGAVWSEAKEMIARFDLKVADVVREMGLKGKQHVTPKVVHEYMKKKEAEEFNVDPEEVETHQQVSQGMVSSK